MILQVSNRQLRFAPDEPKRLEQHANPVIAQADSCLLLQVFGQTRRSPVGEAVAQLSRIGPYHPTQEPQISTVGSRRTSGVRSIVQSLIRLAPPSPPRIAHDPLARSCRLDDLSGAHRLTAHQDDRCPDSCARWFIVVPADPAKLFPLLKRELYAPLSLCHGFPLQSGLQDSSTSSGGGCKILCRPA